MEDVDDVVSVAELQPLTQRLIDRLSCRQPATLERISAVYETVADREGAPVFIRFSCCFFFILFLFSSFLYVFSSFFFMFSLGFLRFYDRFLRALRCFTAAELSLVEFHGYVACVLTQILRELEERREGEADRSFKRLSKTSLRSL